MNDDIADRLAIVEARVARMEQTITDAVAKLRESDPSLSGWWALSLVVGELMGLADDISSRRTAEEESSR